MREFGDAGARIRAQQGEQFMIDAGHSVSHAGHIDDFSREMASSC
jgi:hypothetical protein